MSLGAEPLPGVPLWPALGLPPPGRPGARSWSGSPPPGCPPWARPAGTPGSGSGSGRGDSPDAPGDGPAARSEKEQLRALNARFAGFIDGVRRLEARRRGLEDEAAALRRRREGRAAMARLLERELGEARAAALGQGAARGRLRLERGRLLADIELARRRLEREARRREEAEAAARALGGLAREAEAARAGLRERARALRDECGELRRRHREERAELLERVRGAAGGRARDAGDAGDGPRCDVTAALRDIRAELEGHAAQSAQRTEEWFRVRLDRLSEAAKVNTDAMRSAQEEISEYRRQLQARTTELEALRGTKDSLERQCSELEDQHQADIESYQEAIQQLDMELRSTKWEMAAQLREYQDLLNVKMALDIEIAAYRKLLEGEECRIGFGSGPLSLLEELPKMPSTSLT